MKFENLIIVSKYSKCLWKFWVLGIVFVFVIVSFLGLLDGRPTECIQFFESLFLSAALWLVLAALVGNVYWMLLISFPVALLAPFEIWQRLTIGQPTSMHFVAFAVETTWGEFSNFLLTYGKNIAYIFIPWVLVYLTGVYAAYRMKMKWRNSFSMLGAMTLSGIVFGYYVLQGAPAWMDVDGNGGHLMAGWWMAGAGSGRTFFRSTLQSPCSDIILSRKKWRIYKNHSVKEIWMPIW